MIAPITERKGLPPRHLKTRRILVPRNKTYAARMAHRRMRSTVGIRRTSEWFHTSPEEILKTRPPHTDLLIRSPHPGLSHVGLVRSLDAHARTLTARRGVGPPHHFP